MVEHMRERYNVPKDLQISHAEIVLPGSTYGKGITAYVQIHRRTYKRPNLQVGS